MPIFEVDGQQFEVEDKYVSDFAKEYPNAVTKVDSEEAIYEVSASDYPAYLDTQRAPRRVVPEKTTIPGSHAKPYQITPEEAGFENVLDKDNFQERYGVSPSVMERQTDPIKESVQRLRAKVGSRSNIPQYPIGNRYTFGFGSDYANKEADNIASSQLSAATENELRGAEKAQSKDGFWKSFGKGLKNEGMWTQGLTELDNNLTLAYIAKKAEKEGFDKLPEKEQDLLTASALRIASEAANSDEKTALQIAGMSTAESIPYMLQFMLTSSPASLATSPVRSAIKKAAEKAIKSGISSKLIPVVKGAARTAAVTTKATAMTAMQPTMYADMVSRGTGRATLENGQYAGMEEAESAPMAAYKAFANATIENLSEHSGSMLSGATKAAGNVLKKVPALGGFISNVQKNNVLSGVNKMMKAVGFNGAPEEFFEEQVSTGLNSLLVGDSQFSDFVDWKQQLATLISVGATAGAMTTTGTVMSVPYKKEIKRKYEEATDKVYDYFTPEEFDQFSSSLSRMDIDSRPNFIAQVSDMKGFSPEQINNLTEFATRQAQFDGYAGAVSDYIEDEKVRAQEEIDRVSNKNMGEVIQVNGFGENPVNIVGGFVVFDDEGFVDKKKSSQTIYYLDEDGKRKMASPDKFGELVSRKPLADAYAEALGNVENDILIQEENDLAEEDTPEQAQQDAMILAENGNQVETLDGVGTISQVEQDENAAIVTFQDGKSKRYSIATLKPYVDPALQPLQTEVPISQTETQTSQPEVQPTQDAMQVAQVPSFPVDKEGNIDYTQIQEPEQYAQALQQEFEGDAVYVIDEQIQSAQAKLEKAGKNTDAIKKRRAMKAAQMELDRLNNVKSLLTPSEQIVNETIPNTVENEESSPSEQSNVIDLSQLTEPERRRYVVDNSTDPIELADIYEQSKDEVDYAQMMPWEAALVGRKVSKDSFIENSDKNNITGAMSKSWFSKDGKSLDVLAQELSEFGVPVTEQDIVNFMMAHPGNSVKKRSQLSIDADRRFKETVKELTGQDVGGVESSSGKLILAGLRAGQRSEQERQALPFSTYTIPDSVLNFFEETGINPEDFNTFEELRDAVAKEQENGTFVFPLGETDLQIINNIINHGIEQQQDYANFAARVEKAGAKRAIEQPVLETEAGNQLQPIEAEGEQVDIEPTPEEIAEIEAQLEVKKRPDNIFEAISEIALKQDIRDAEKEVNTTPTEAQKEAGNYKMGHVTIQGLDVSIENPKGSQRSGKDDTGQEWSVTLNNSYGYIKGTKGKDGDHVDVFLGDNPSSENVFVIDQVNKDGSFDEHKVMLGFNSQEEAEAAYKSNYSEGWTGLGSVTPMNIDDFKAWVTEGKKSEPATQEIAEDVPTNEELVEDEILFRDGQSETEQIKSEAEKNGTFMKAPNGKDSNLNEKQWLQVRTKAFKEWFGDWENDPENASKVVDENGEPLVVYHGSRNGKFDVFNPSKGNPTLGGGMYFSDSIELANKFAGTKGFVYSVFLNIKNPMHGQFNGSGSDMARSEYRDGGIFTKSNTDRYANEGEKEYIVFDPNQIKSATDNTGEFSQNNDDIRFRDAELDRLDKEYLDAVESGDMEKAQRIVDQVAKKNGYVSESEYRLSHRAPHMQTNTTPQQRFDEGRALSIEDMANGYLNVPDEFFDARNGAQWYGYDTREGMESYRSLMRAMREIKQQIKENGKVTDMPKVTVYRAVYKEVKEGSVRNGDWVSLSQSYAKSHGNAWVDGPSRVIKEEVPADQIWWDSNDINEFGVDDGKGYSYKNTKNNKKLNETVTRDDEGNIIPPSKRFNSRSSDVRFREGESTQEVSNVEKEATTLSESLNTPIRLVRDVNEITNEDKKREKRMRSAKGWYDPKTGEVVIVLPNAESVGDVQATILHEVVGHKGLRGLLGDKFEEMMDKVYKHLPKKERQKIMAAAMDKYKFDYRTATEEYLAEFVERDVMEPSLWQKIKSAIKSFFRNIGVNLEMSDPDIAYLLWKSKNRLQSGDALSKINSIARDLEAKERFREAPYTEADVLSDQLDDASKRAWESLSRDQRTVHEMVNETAELRKGVLKYFPTKEGVKKSIYELTQGLFDNAVSLKALQNLVNEVSNEPIESYANPYQFLTTIPARNEHKMKTFVKTKFSKIGQAIKEMGVPQSTVQVYAYLKHGIERNRYMRGRDIEDKTRKLQEEAEKRIDPIRDSIEYLSQQLETADKKNTQRILAKIEGYNQAILDIQSETQVKASEYAQKVEDKDYSGVFQVADLFIQEMEDRKMTVAQIESAIEQFEKEHDTTNFWEAVNGATKWTVQNEFEMGRISKEVRDKIFSMYDYYIPLKGWEEENANEVWDYMSGQGIPVSPIKKAGGRKSLAQNPFENIGLAAQTSIMGGHKNLLKLHALRMVRNYPNKLYRVSEVWVVDEGDNWVMKAPEYSENAETYAENVIKFEEEMNELKEQGLAKKVMGKLDVGKPITKYEAKEHEVLVYENGKPYIIYVNDNPDIARAINMTSTKPYEVGGNDPSGKNGLKWAANQTMRLMRFTGQNLTSRNPAFVAANLLMDTQWAIAAASAKEGSAYAKKLVGNYMSYSVHSSILRGVRGKLDESNPMDKMFADFQRAGGETGYSDLFKLEDFQKMLKEGLKDGTDWRKIYTWYTGSIDMLNRWAELASRFSTFVTSRNSGRDIERSAYDAKEITLNFNRKGTGAFLGNWLKFAYLFAGAGLQGAYSMANLALSKRSQKRITMVFAGTAMLGFIIPLINDMFLGGDDDDLYSKKPDYERKSNFLIRIPGTDSFFKFPIAQSLRPFYNIGETLYQMVKGNRNAGEGTIDIIGGFGMLLPFDPFGGSSLMPSAFQPIYQVKENKDFFGQKIYKDDSFTKYDPEFKRAFSNTSPAFVELTRALNEITGGDEVTKGWANVNPAILEHLVEGYLGGAFKFVNDIGKQVNGAIEVSKGNEYPYDSRSYPIVGRFYTNTAATSDINAEYYKVVNDSEELNHRVRKYQELGRKGDQEAFEKSLELMSSPEYKKAIFVKAFKKRIDDLKKTAKDGNMEKNPVLKGQERELKIIMLNEIEKLDEK